MPKTHQPGVRRHPGRHGQAADISQAILWLISNAASHINGATLRIDGAASAAMRGGTSA